MHKTQDILAGFYERDLRKLIEEINLFKTEGDLWKTIGSVKNSAGNLALHITGGLNHFFGTVLGKTGYVRDRDAEFARRNVPRSEIVDGLEKVIVVIKNSLNSLSAEQMEGEFPVFFDKPRVSTGYVVTQLSLHLNYHLGQVNYLRRILE